MKSFLHKHISAFEKAHDALAEILPHARPTVGERVRWLIPILGIILLIFAFWQKSQKDEVNETSTPIKTELPVMVNPEITFGEKLATQEINDSLITRAIVHRIASAQNLRFYNFTDLEDNNSYQRALTSLVLAESKSEQFLPQFSLEGLQASWQLSKFSELLSQGSWLQGIQNGQNLAYEKTILNNRAARLTQILAELRLALSQDSFFPDGIKNPPNEIDTTRIYLQEKQAQAFNAIEEVRQIALHIKGQYQLRKDEKSARGAELTDVIETGKAPDVSGSSEEYKKAAAKTASLEAEFLVFQKLEQDFRLVIDRFKNRLDYIDKHYADLALGLCDWNTC